MRRHRRLLWLLPLWLAFAAGPARGQEGLSWRSYGAAVEAAAARQKPVLVYVHADGCGWCYRMERDVFAVDTVRAYLARHFELTRLDLGDESPRYRIGGRTLSDAALARHLGASGTPTLLFLDPEGRPVLRLASYADAGGLYPMLVYMVRHAYREQPFASSPGGRR